MAKLTTDSLLSRRIAHSFLDFLNYVEVGEGVDAEALEVAKECLTEVFKLNSPSLNHFAKPDSLIDIFTSLEDTHSVNNLNRTDSPVTSKSLGDDWTTQPNAIGTSKDELFGQFIAALEKIHFIGAMPDGNDDPDQLDKATRLFHDAVNEMERSGGEAYNQNTLAETLKSQGNGAMQSKLYSEAIELYSLAIALCENNAVYYCNRAAAYTQINSYADAIRDCYKSVEIDPNYSKAYSRLGLAYYAQGNYIDAINKGFKKALQLDPNNEYVRENIRVAVQKLRDPQQWTERDQNTSSDHNNQESQSTAGSRSHGIPPFMPMPFNTSALPVDFASMLRNMVGNASQGQTSHDRQGEDGNGNGPDEPGIRVGNNFNLNFGEQMPEDITGALRSMMEMFSGAAPHGSSQDTTHERPAAN
ncbi:TPR_2 domain-containing protein/TPR_11 domain-containing protein [Cephalotus follicularis]|uniref:TPR_2 domain-containing protein/TPR_11 domain-containing protein n=1 Tax=Cephalotus follicularis TaxID=3775 RepID=A0A1Q3BVX0_CEPFO|nr:TPR_2 domain-containing protein/TPR_11 domain-containing protein [Cephalotus follicularis]